MFSVHGTVQKRPFNWLLMSLIILSVGVHVIIFAHIAGIYRSKTITYLEMSLRSFTRPNAREIPRPRQRPESIPQPGDLRLPEPVARTIPRAQPVQITDVEPVISDPVVASVTKAEIPEVENVNISQWDSEITAPKRNEKNHHQYFDLVRLKIERHKRYPRLARRRNIEGRVTVGFVIIPDGSVKRVRVVQSSRFKILDRAALRAVTESMPFPKPPQDLSKSALPLQLTIVFELT
jgi:protein TonB